MQPEIIQEDKYIIVCRKAAGIATQTKRIGQQDMESMLRSYRAHQGEEPYIGIVHRLDQPVEGIMVFAKTKEAAASLSAQVKGRTIGKRYYAIGVLGDGKGGNAKTEKSTMARPGEWGFPEQGTLTDYLVVDKKSNHTAVAEIAGMPKGNPAAKPALQKAVLDYRILGQKEGLVLFDIALCTGRHHQIRAQLAHAGFPLLGDVKYGEEANRGRANAQLALCAYRLQFAHPATGQPVDLSIRPQNPSFQFFVEAINVHSRVEKEP